MKGINGKNKQKLDPRSIDGQRRGLLAKLHIAIKELGIPEDDYRNILKVDYGVATAAALSVRELEDLVRRCEKAGWRAQRAEYMLEQVNPKDSQLQALRARAREISHQIENGEHRLRGLCKSLCGVERLEWCKDAETLKRVVVTIGCIRKREKEGKCA